MRADGLHGRGAGRITLRISHPDGDGRITGFRFFWAFIATGYRPDRHCQPGLRGAVSQAMNTTNAATGAFEFTILPGRLLYICGVSSGPVALRRDRNLHLPLVPSAGITGSETTYNGYQLSWRDATRLPIPEVRPRAGLTESHYRCKNFRVAEAFFGADR